MRKRMIEIDYYTVWDAETPRAENSDKEVGEELCEICKEWYPASKMFAFGDDLICQGCMEDLVL